TFLASVSYSGPSNYFDAILDGAGFRAPVSSTNVIGNYTLTRITLIDSGGQTVFNRDGTINRLFYQGNGLPTNHSLNFSNLDFSIVASPPPPLITAQPVPLTFNSGQAATFSVQVQSQLPVTYQWRK